MDHGERTGGNDHVAELEQHARVLDTLSQMSLIQMSLSQTARVQRRGGDEPRRKTSRLPEKAPLLVGTADTFLSDASRLRQSNAATSRALRTTSSDAPRTT
jgi:hypothetical protein